MKYSHFVTASSLFSCRNFTLVRVVNVVKRVDAVQGSRYLLELEVEDPRGQLLRLAHYIYSLMDNNKDDKMDFSTQQPKTQLLLCNPVGFRWNPAATVHFIVPGAFTFIPIHLMSVAALAHHLSVCSLSEKPGSVGASADY